MQTTKPKLCQHLKYLSKQSLNKIVQRPIDQTCTLHENNQMYYICLHCGVSCCLGQQQNLNCIEFHFRQTQSHYFSLEIDLGTIWCSECKDSIQNMLFAYDIKEKDQHFNKVNRFATFIGQIWKQISTKISSSKQVKIVRGLKNLGNTCFLNVVLQTLNFTSPLKKLYQKYQRTDIKLKYNSRFINKEIEMFYDDMLQNKKSEEWNVVRDKKHHHNKNQKMRKKRQIKSAQFNFFMQDFFREMDLSNESAYKPVLILDFLGKINIKYTLNEEQDAEQLFLTILDLLSEGERFSLLNDKERYTQIEKLLGFQKLVPIESLFGFDLLNQIQCNQCKQITHNVNLTYTLPITLQATSHEDYDIQHKDRKIDIDYWQDLFYPNQSHNSNFLDHFFKVQKLSLSKNFYSCSKCKSVLAYRKYYLIDQPQILVVSIKRFNSQLQKNSKHIAFPATFDLSPYCASPGPTTYNLYGVIVHQGKRISTGHYLCFVKYENRWFLCSDHKVQLVEEKYVLAQQAYILFYQRVQNDV